MNLTDPPLRDPALQELRDSHLRLLSIHRSFQDLYGSSVAIDPQKTKGYAEKLPALLELAQRRLDEENEAENTGSEEARQEVEQDQQPAQPSLRKRIATGNAGGRAGKASKTSREPGRPKRGKSSSYMLDIPRRSGAAQIKKEMHKVYRRWTEYTPWRGKLTSNRLSMWCSLARVNGTWRGSATRRVLLWRNLGHR